ncbi:hypothetical protein ABZ671_00950 [Micromonospora sp. NPDC006766]|uniref:hypothetical protein n=1 Tax=Micromonospora sp. NPDC006766 TaxID=3154778 RepID=UPI0033D42014
MATREERLSAAAARAYKSLETRIGDDHLPSPGLWWCRGCGQDVEWPCAAARASLVKAYSGDRPGLLFYLDLLYARALVDLPPQPKGQLRARIVGWAR